MTSTIVEDDATRSTVPPLSGGLQLVRAVLVLVLVLSVTLILQLTVVSRLQHQAAQGRKFDDFRKVLALGTAPIGPTTDDGEPVVVGTPVALLEIRAIGLTEVVSEGTSAGVLFDGAGHRRDSPLPGQVGTSVVHGRRASFGGPFGSLADLRVDDVITATTGQGVFTYRVIGVRRAGDPIAPPVAANSSRLMLVTADGLPFLPNGVVRVDADLVGTATGGPARVATASLPAEEQLMAIDARTLWALALWLQVLIAISLAVVWSWHRWGRAQTWIVFLPLSMLVGLAVAGEIARLLPNLL